MTATKAPDITDTPTPTRGRARRSQRHVGESASAYTLLAPNLLLLGLFVLLPLGGAVLISLQETDGFGGGEFAGLANYRRLFGDPLFWRATGNTILFTAIVTPLSMAAGLGLAVLFNTALPAQGIFRSVMILPMAISGVATALMGVLLFDQNSGILDKMVRFAGLPDIQWQTSGAAAFASVVLMTLWWRMGFNMLIYLAGLQSIGPELYEAARLDGANWWQRMRHITVPMLAPSSFFLLVLNVIYSFQVFDLVFVMTGGGPQNATTVLVTYAYDQGFVTRDQGYAAAIGVFLLLFTLALTAVQWRRNRARDWAQ